MVELLKRIHHAEQAMRREVESAMISGARSRNVPIECDKSVYLMAPAEQLTIASAPVAGLYDRKLEDMLKGEPVLFVYFSEMELMGGARMPPGFYLVSLQAEREVAEFTDGEGRNVGTGDLTIAARAPGGALRAKRVSADIEGPDLCYEICVKVCLTLKVDLPGPINPEFRICIRVVIKV